MSIYYLFTITVLFVTITAVEGDGKLARRNVLLKNVSGELQLKDNEGNNLDVSLVKTGTLKGHNILPKINTAVEKHEGKKKVAKAYVVKINSDRKEELENDKDYKVSELDHFLVELSD